MWTVVAPLAGAWIEMAVKLSNRARQLAVAPLAGAWIEILEFGKKGYNSSVAPLAGAWIEIVPKWSRLMAMLGRSPRGSVD